MRYYRLDENKNPVPCRSVLEWGRWMETADAERVVGKDEVAGLTVSTVFLGVGHVSNVLGESGWDWLYETMVFGPDDLLAQLGDESREDITSVFVKVLGRAEVQRRYRTRQEAEAGHAEMVGHVRRVMAGRN